ncbi:hypothetical protein C0J52_14569, partial [Blattella germanica]
NHRPVRGGGLRVRPRTEDPISLECEAHFGHPTQSLQQEQDKPIHVGPVDGCHIVVLWHGSGVGGQLSRGGKLGEGLKTQIEASTQEARSQGPNFQVSRKVLRAQDSGVSEQRSTNSCLFCCQKGTIIVSASLKRRAFVPGEDILVFADILNMSNTIIHRSSVKLIQVVTYFSNKGFRSHVDEVVIAQVYRGRVPCGESDAWDGVRIRVPPLPPTSKFDNFCKLMDVEYRLDMPIMIGTVPLYREFAKLQQESTSTETDDVPPLLPQCMETKYTKLPAVYSGPCIWGARPIELYYYRQIMRRPEAPPAPGRIPQIVLAPHQRDKVFTPRYVCYRSIQQPPPGTGFAHGVPQIVITQHPPCPRHNHLPPTSRRHSAPGHIMRDPMSPTHKLPDIPEVK